MPIFIKRNRLIYFAHIPKTAGTSIYHSFASSGWSIFNVTAYKSPTSTYSSLKKLYSIDCSKLLVIMSLILIPCNMHLPFFGLDGLIMTNHLP